MKRGYVWAGLLALLLAGCGSGGGSGGSLPGGGSGNTGGPPQNVSLPRSTRAQWTVLVYMNGANNLEQFSVENMAQMESVTPSSNVNVVVEWKRLHEQGSAVDQQFSTAIPQWDGTRRFWVRGDASTQSDYIQDLGSGAVGSFPNTADLGDYRELNNFLKWGEQNFPADHYAVILWNHGAGWEHVGIQQFTRSQVIGRGISYDDESAHSIETWQLPAAFSGAGPVDLIAMDASLMQMTEVDYEMQSLASYIVGSEDSPPADGYPYQLWLPALTSNPSMSALNLGTTIANTFASFYQNNTDSAGNQDSVTQSVVDTSRLPAVAQAVSQLANVLVNDSSQYGAQFAAARDSAHEYAIENGSTQYPEYKDLVEYSNLLVQNAPGAPGLAAAVNAVKQAVSNAVVDNRAIRNDAFSNGLSIYVPQPPSFNQVPLSYDSTYQNLQFAHDTNWPRWLTTQPQ